jgi:hypothetical protein
LSFCSTYFFFHPMPMGEKHPIIYLFFEWFYVAWKQEYTYVFFLLLKWPSNMWSNHIIWKEFFLLSVATLALGSQPRKGLAKLRAKCEGKELHFMLPGVWESVKEWTPTLPSELPLWELESRWTPEYSLSRPQVPCRPTWGSKYATMRKELELGARSRLPALEGVRGAC